MTDATLDTAKVIVGQSGAGKTVTAKHDVEQLLADRRHVAIYDPTGVWYGLRSDAAGTGPGFDVPIFGGEHGDVPIRPTDGAAIARIIIEQRVSAIVDLSGMDNSRDWRRFMDDHVAALRGKPKANFHPVFDEADEFAPERPADDIGFRLRENMVWLAKRGRVKGFVPTFITQRTAEIAWAVISQAQTIVAHQLMAPTDQASIEKYLKSHGSAEQRKVVMESLATLAVGERWIYSPRLKILERGMTPPIATFDSSRTPAPGELHVEPRTLAQLDVSSIRAALAPLPADPSIPSDPVKAYEAGAATGEMLIERDRRIADLESMLAGAQRAGRLQFTRALAAEDAADALRRGLAALRDRVAGLMTAAEWFDLPQDVTDNLDSPNANLHPSDALSTEPPIEADVCDPAPAEDRGRGAAALPTVLEQPSPPGNSSTRGRRALQALVAYHPLGLIEEQWAFIAGFTRKGGTWGTYKSALRASGLIVESDGRWRATDAGVAEIVGPLPAFPNLGPDLATYWGAKTASTGKLVAVLIKRFPHFVTRDGLAADVGMSPTGGSYGTYLSRLRSKRLIEEQGKRLRLAPALMEKL